MPSTFSKSLAATVLAVAGLAVQAAGPSPAPADAELYFISPANGAHVTGPLTVRFGLRGMGVAPAGVDVPATGHHHLLVNADPMPDLTRPLPSSDQVRHFGKGQTETTLELPPGTYTLQLVLGDAGHVPFDPPVMSGTIKVTVEIEEGGLLIAAALAYVLPLLSLVAGAVSAWALGLGDAAQVLGGLLGLLAGALLVRRIMRARGLRDQLRPRVRRSGTT